MDYKSSLEVAKEKAMKFNIPFFIYKKRSNGYGVVSQEMAQEQGVKSLLSVVDAKGHVHNEIREEKKKKKKKKSKGLYSGAFDKAEKHTKYDPPQTGNVGKSARRGFIG